MTPKTLKDRAEQAFTKRDRYKPLFQDAYDYTMPTRQGFDHSDQIGLSRTDRIFDETAVVGVTEFAAEELLGARLCPFKVALLSRCAFNAADGEAFVRESKILD